MSEFRLTFWWIFQLQMLLKFFLHVRNLHSRYLTYFPRSMLSSAHWIILIGWVYALLSHKKGYGGVNYPPIDNFNLKSTTGWPNVRRSIHGNPLLTGYKGYQVLFLIPVLLASKSRNCFLSQENIFSLRACRYYWLSKGYRLTFIFFSMSLSY